MNPGFLCAIHLGRAAVARCPSCRSYFCAECVAEHDGRMLCAECLARRIARDRSTASRWRRVTSAFAALAGLAIAWVAFAWLGSELASKPHPIHQQDLWRETPLQSP